MLKCAFTDFIFPTNTDRSGKTVSCICSLGFFEPIQARYYQQTREIFPHVMKNESTT